MPDRLEARESAPAEKPINITIYAAAQTVSSVGGWMQKAAVGWLCWEMTHSPGWVGALALTDVVTAVSIGPLAGALIDRASPFRVVLSTQSLLIVQALILSVLALTGTLTLPALFALALAESAINGLNQPALMTVINLLAERERLSRAIAMNSIAFNLARIGGPAVAGIMMVKAPVGWIFVINAASYLAMITVILYLRRWTDRRPAPTDLNFLGDVAAGVRYVVRAPEISTVFLLAGAFCCLVRPITELMPAVTGEFFQGGPGALSGLMSAQGVGATIGAVWMLRRRETRALAHTAFGATLAAAVVLMIFCANPDLRVATVFIGVFGAFHVVSNVSMQSLAQTYAAPAYRGRVIALYSLFFRAVPCLGAFLLGLAATYLGLKGLLFGGAFLALPLIVLVGLRARRISAPQGLAGAAP